MVRFRSDFSRCSTVGLMTNFPSTRPTRTPAMGPLKGISETERAQDAPIIAAMSGGLSCSTERTVAMTCMSLRKPLGKSGRMGRSMSRAQRMAALLGRPSRLMKPPGIFPTAYIFSS